ncbi:MAG: hypothetical protein IPK07_34820 [Deltaproteobacteria bacterium]|nr:hypothetical protein [Deltaproteobacteria bacterium]
MARARSATFVSALAVVLVASIGCSSGGGSAIGRRAPFARAFQVTDRNQLIGGATATAAVGDFMLENDQIRLAVVGAFESAGPNLYGGGLVDADLQRPDARPADGRDELGEIFPVVDIRVQRPDEPEQLTGSTQPIASSVKVLAAGGDGADQRAIVRVEAALVPYLAITDLIPLDLQTSDVRIVHDYILEPGKRYLTIRTEVRYGAEAKTEFVPERSFTVTYSPGPLKVLVPILLGQTFGDIALFGGKTDLFSPSFGFDAFSAQLQPAANPTPDRYWNEAAPFRNTFEDPLTGPFFAGVGKRISYGMTTPRGTLTIPLVAGDVAPAFYASSLDVRDAAGRSPSPAAGQPGDAITYERYFLVGEGDVASVLDVVNEVRGLTTGVLAGRVVEEASGTALSGARVLVFDHPRDARGDLRDLSTLDWRDLGFPVSQFQTDVRLADGIPDGSFEGTIVPGHYVLVGVSSGRGRSPLVPVEVVAGQRTPASVVVPRSGKVRVEVRDAGRAGAGLPSKITLTELDGHGIPWARFGEGSLPLSRLPRDGAIYEPQTADPARADLEFVAAYRYTTDGRAVFELEPGRYRVHASRGYEYSIDQRDVTAEAGLEKLVVLTIARAVDSTGWITADFHVHSESSHDASCPKIDRVKGHAAQASTCSPPPTTTTSPTIGPTSTSSTCVRGSRRSWETS